MDLSSFNSTLVRFNANEDGQTLTHYPCFNSTLVRFNGRSCFARRHSIRGFNSTLVRFNGANIVTSWIKDGLFQFHPGSIQRRDKLASPHCFFNVSIPPWFDSTLKVVVEGCRKGKVSIPPWFDSTVGIQSGLLFIGHVSIPPWFDSTGVTRQLYENEIQSFNSTLVRFNVIWLVYQGQEVYRFNSTLVRFNDWSK